ncbi:MAG: DUF547 domain-containing protein [Crocinitomix sp.]|nr:DUF547 domain-containing protein [Crocinitomix sp.]
MKRRLLKILKRTVIVLLIISIGFFAYLKISGQTFNEAGLRFLSWVKDVKGDNVDFSEFDNNETEVITHQLWTELLTENVAQDGKVNYNGFISNSEKYEKYLALLSDHPPGKNWSQEDKLAYWINAYNAFTVKLIVDNYPVKSIKDIGGSIVMINSAWDMKFFKIGGVDFDLNTIEHEIIRKLFDEPRIHFAINCASISCPKLRNEGYEADKLEGQLSEQTFSFLNDKSKNQITSETSKLSKLFNWFEGDFEKNGSLASFIKIYQLDFKEENSIEYLDYNWALNE